MTDPRELAEACLGIEPVGDAAGLWPTRARDLALALLAALGRADSLERERDEAREQVSELKEYGTIRQRRAAEARADSLETALREIADWSSLSATRHGHMGVTDFARAALGAATEEDAPLDRKLSGDTT